MNMEKFTERSRGFLQAAQTIAMREGHQRVLPEHLLKSLMDDDQGLSANLIRKAGGAPERVTEAVNLTVAKMPKVSGGDGQVYVDTALVRVLDEAEKLAKKAGDSFVPAERILMALAMVNTKAKDALDAGAVTAQKLNTAINDIRKGRTADTASAEEGYDALKKYARDLTEMAAQAGKLDPVIGRDEEIRRTIQVLSRRTKNNPVLIGEPGVGKTAIAEGLALRIVKGDVPESLKDKKLMALDMGSLIDRGCQVSRRIRGAPQGRSVGSDRQRKAGEIILFIDEMHTLDRSWQVGRGDGCIEPAEARHLRAANCTAWVPRRWTSTASTSRRTRRSPVASSPCSWVSPRWKTPCRSCAASRRSMSCTMACASPTPRWCPPRSLSQPLHRRPLPARQGHRPDGRSRKSRLRMQVDSKPEELDEIDRQHHAIADRGARR